jgi:tetratricopeptide (TPR) repeat protein
LEPEVLRINPLGAALIMSCLAGCGGGYMGAQNHPTVMLLGHDESSDVIQNYVMPGYEARQNGNLNEDIEDQSIAISQDPGFPAAYLERGTAYFLQDDYDKAIADFNVVVKSGPSLDRTVSLIEQAYLLRALSYQAKELYPQAIADYQSALKLDPKNARAWYGLGTAKQATHAAGAEDDFATAEKLDPGIGQQH